MNKTRKSLSFNRRMQGCVNAVRISFKEKQLYQVSALTLNTLLAIVPLITVSIYIAALMPFFDTAINGLREYAFTNFIPELGIAIEEHLLEFVSSAVKLPIGGVIFLFLTVAMLMILVKTTMNDIWHSPKHSTWKSLIASWIVLLCMPLLVGFSVFSSYYFLSLFWVHYTINQLGLEFILSTLVPVFINTVAFSLLYYVSPNCHVEVSDSIFGGLIAAVLFEIAKRIFEFYFRFFGNYDVIYGSLAVIPTFMIWVYMSWGIIIFGGIVTYAQNQQRIV